MLDHEFSKLTTKPKGSKLITLHGGLKLTTIHIPIVNYQNSPQSMYDQKSPRDMISKNSSCRMSILNSPRSMYDQNLPCDMISQNSPCSMSNLNSPRGMISQNSPRGMISQNSQCSMSNLNSPRTIYDQNSSRDMISLNSPRSMNYQISPRIMSFYSPPNKMGFIHSPQSIDLNLPQHMSFSNSTLLKRLWNKTETLTSKARACLYKHAAFPTLITNISFHCCANVDDVNVWRVCFDLPEIRFTKVSLSFCIMHLKW